MKGDAELLRRLLMNPDATEEWADETMKIAESMIPDLARLHKSYFDHLLEVGFSENQAMMILTSLPVMGLEK